MKVLFAVNNEEISESIIKLYQKQYREIISGKNVYYFNAIIKELQRDQTYDRVVISEDLEPYTNNNFDIIDKFLFEQLDKISDEAISGGGGDIPIIFIATDRRSKSDNLLSKLFSIGIYDALLGSDRNIPEVCKLLNKPRTKKEAKLYYKIETDEVSYQAESEDSVSETEIQNILTHYKKLGKNTERYVESFNNIAAQYNDAQLRIITKFLPISVKAVLEAESPKYQSIMTFGEGTYKKPQEREEKKHDLKIGFIETHSDKGAPKGPVVIPSAVNKDKAQKLTRIKEKPIVEKDDSPKTDNDDEFSSLFEDIDDKVNNIETEEPKVQPVKRGRGRPRKQVVETSEEEKAQIETKPRKRGRPRKQAPEQEEIAQTMEEKENILPGFEDIEKDTMPGAYEEETDSRLPGFEEYTADYEDNESSNEKNVSVNEINSPYQTHSEEDNYIQNTNNYEDSTELARYLSRDKKVVTFVGTSKAGTSFLINNVADYLAKSGIKTAILDATTNRNSYYIYTKNEEPLRRKAQNCIENLEQDILDGIEVSKNLTVFTSVPGKRTEINSIEAVIANLVKQYSLVLIDCDFETPFEYFKLAQEIYLVQSMDILTIQPLTAFLRDLQSANMLDSTKLKIIINKAMKVRGLSTSAIIGGMSCYNDPEMSYMRNLFDKDKIQAITIPFDGDVLSRYLSGMVDCIVSINGYSKQFISELKKLSDMVYPLINNRFKVDYTKNNKFANNEQEQQDSFSSSMNSTLDRMKKQFK